MTGEPGDDAPQVIRSRFSVVDALRATPRQKPELGEHLDVSRSTIDRAIRELESAGLVAREDDGYAVTLYGSLLAERYEAFLRETDDVTTAGPLLETLPPDAPMSIDVLADATVDRAVPPVPHQPVSRFERLLRDADRLRGLSRTISQSTTPDLIRERVEEGMVGELVVGSELGSYMREHRREPEGEMIETGRYRLLEVERVPYGLAILDVDRDAYVVVFVYGENNDLLGTITNDAPAAVAWADRIYDRYRSEAEDVSDEFRG